MTNCEYSIIVPVYNRPDEVAELLESLTAQTVKDFEVIIVEDGSERDCRAVAEQYAGKLDVRYFANEWYNRIIIRTAKDEQDYRGGFNHYTTLEYLDVKTAELLDDLPF